MRKYYFHKTQLFVGFRLMEIDVLIPHRLLVDMHIARPRDVTTACQQTSYTSAMPRDQMVRQPCLLVAKTIAC
jgi:hypothetical protein